MAVLVMLILLLLCPSPKTASSTQPQCHGCGQKPICNCSGQKLRRVPTVATKSVIELDLSSNELQVIMENDFHTYGGHLRVLNMSNNMITTIKEEAFSPLVNLENLDLSFNRMSSFSATCFKSLSSLQLLNILGNEYETLGQGYLFQTLSTLKTLQFGGPLLHSVNLHDFVGLYGLEELVFNGRNLTVYHSGSLGKIGQIGQVTLSLHGPFHNNADLIRNILMDVMHLNTTMIFTDTTFYTADIMLPIIEFKQRVRHLVLRNIGMTDIASGSFFSQLSNSTLTYVEIVDSKLFLEGGGVLYSIPKLDHVVDVVLKNFYIPQFYNFPALYFVGPLGKYLRKVSMINCMVHTIPCSGTKEFSTLQYIDMSENLVHDQTMKEMLCDGQGVLRDLRTINFSRNSLKSLNSELFTKLDKLATLDLSGNSFHIMPETCDWPSSLRVLNLSACHLTKVTRCLPKSLNVLDLSNNVLTVFNIDLPLLIELYITSNNILSLPDGDFYPSLEVLLISHNALQTFNSKDLGGYNKLRVMEAGSNSYLCSCAFLTFMQGGTGHLSTLHDGLGAYVCESPDAMRGTQVLEAELSVFECHMAVALSILCSSVLMVFLIFGGLCYKLNVLWYMKMTWAWLRAKQRPVLKRGDICYDAFVSYSERDSVWVEDHLVANLEDAQPPLRLCLHKRDFLPGGWVLDNIMDAIEKSHKTLFILSQHFVKSEWCKYELEYSHFRLFDANNDTSVLILLEPIAKETIPKRFCKLRKIMNSRTYLEWPDDDEQIPRFWQSLKETIQRHH